MRVRFALLAAGVLAAALAFGAAAQTTIVPNHDGSGATTPASNDADVLAAAKNQQATGKRAARATTYSLAWPLAQEMEPMERYAVLLLTAVTQTANELPLKRLHIQAAGVDFTATKILSLRSTLGQNTVVGTYFGPYREDAFYLVPVSLVLRDGKALLDWAVTRTDYSAFPMPMSADADYLKGAIALPRPGVMPNKAALAKFFQREYAGFPQPK